MKFKTNVGNELEVDADRSLLVVEEGVNPEIPKEPKRHADDYTPPRGVLRSEIINSLIYSNGYKKYLQIGGGARYKNFDLIMVDYKVDVDPLTEATHTPTFSMTSDDFFETTTDMFDIVFIDGVHESEQVYMDIVNALSCLNDGGVIVCHDMDPWNELVQRVPKQSISWVGDSWKAFVRLRMERHDLEMCVINTDCGLGIIRRGTQKKLKTEELIYDNLVKNRKIWLNLVSVAGFYDMKSVKLERIETTVGKITN